MIFSPTAPTALDRLWEPCTVSCHSGRYTARQQRGQAAYGIGVHVHDSWGIGGGGACEKGANGQCRLWQDPHCALRQGGGGDRAPRVCATAVRAVLTCCCPPLPPQTHLCRCPRKVQGACWCTAFQKQHCMSSALDQRTCNARRAGVKEEADSRAIQKYPPSLYSISPVTVSQRSFLATQRLVLVRFQVPMSRTSSE